MNQISVVIFLSFIIFTSVAEAKIITFEKCVPHPDDLFDKSAFEKFNLVIDTEKKTITEIVVTPDKMLKELKEIFKNDPKQLAFVEKIRTQEFNLIFFDQDYAKGYSKILELNGYVSGEHTIQINLRNKSYEKNLTRTRNKNEGPMITKTYCK